jgi:hypothetical protein
MTAPLPVPDLVFLDLEGQPMPLSRWSGQPVVLVLLRWLG